MPSTNSNSIKKPIRLSPKEESLRQVYNQVASTYAELYFHELEGKPLDRELLAWFGRLVGQQGQVCDMGCGPGEVAAFLKQQGINVFGMDVSDEMIATARKICSDIQFQTGTMRQLEMPSGSLAGITAFYAIVNFNYPEIGRFFREFHRVLKPGGWLLLSFHVGEEILQLDKFFGKKLAINFHLLNPDKILALLKATGFSIKEALVRFPYPDEHQTKRAYLMVCK